MKLSFLKQIKKNASFKKFLNMDMKKAGLALAVAIACIGFTIKHNAQAMSNTGRNVVVGTTLGGIFGGGKGAGIGAAAGFLTGAMQDSADNRNSNVDPIEERLRQLRREQRKLNKEKDRAIRKNNLNQAQGYDDHLRQIQREIDQLSGR